MTRAAPALLAAAALAALVTGPLRAQEARPQVERQGEHNAPSVPDEMQPDQLPTLPPGMTVGLIVSGDSLYHGKGACFVCHGAEGEGEPAAGDAISVALNYAHPEWRSLDSLITAGIPDALTRSPIRMPGRGGRSDLTDDEIRRVAAYVWAISQTHGEPWPGGHQRHGELVPPGASAGTATAGPGELNSRTPPQERQVVQDHPRTRKPRRGSGGSH